VSNSTRPSSAPTTTAGGYDERFEIPLEASRRGAHRARVSPVMAALPVVAVAAIVIGAIALVAALLGGTGGPTAGANATTAVTPTPTPTASGTPSDGAAASGGPSPSESAATSAEVDKTLPVAVYNATSPAVSGLGKRVAAKLVAAGWTTGTVASWPGPQVLSTTVFYGKEEQRPSAQALAKALGHAALKLSASKAGAGLAVAVANDYSGAGTGIGTGTTGGKSSGTSPSRSSATKPSVATSKSPKASASPADTPATDPAGTPSPTQ
jgi:hypothetical protein